MVTLGGACPTQRRGVHRQGHRHLVQISELAVIFWSPGDRHLNIWRRELASRRTGVKFETGPRRTAWPSRRDEGSAVRQTKTGESREVLHLSVGPKTLGV